MPSIKQSFFRSAGHLVGCLVRTALVAAVPSHAQVQTPAVTAPPIVEAVRCEGLMHVRPEAVLDVVRLKTGAEFGEEQMEVDRKAVLRLGYFRTVTSSQRTVNGKTTVVFRMVEWPQVSHVRVLGNSVVARRTILDSISTQVGQVFNAAQLVDDIHAIEQLYRERGYVAHVSERILDEATRTGILRFEVLEVRVGEVAFEGGDEALRQRCRKAVREIPPALYRPEAVTVDQARLLRIKGVRFALPKVETLDAEKVRIRWQINPPESQLEPMSPQKSTEPKGS